MESPVTLTVSILITIDGCIEGVKYINPKKVKRLSALNKVSLSNSPHPLRLSNRIGQQSHIAIRSQGPACQHRARI